MALRSATAVSRDATSCSDFFDLYLLLVDVDFGLLQLLELDLESREERMCCHVGAHVRYVAHHVC